jgi:glycosyltransferase involved in cell wall biosynthesis
MGGAKGVVVAADYAALLVSKPFPQPLVIQLHGSSTVNALQRNESPRRLVRALERRELRLASGVRAVSDFTAATTFRALGVAKKKTVVVPNSVDGDLFRPGDETPTPGRILFVGKLNTIKGARVLAEIVGPVLDAVSEAHFVIVGQDTTEGGRSVLEDMKRVIPEGSGERVRFAGRLSRQEVADIYRSSAVVVMPSLSEACPMVALESMASGRPVVASRRAAIPEFVVDGVTGILADPSRPRDFAGALVRILREPALARAMGEAARGQALARYAREPVMHRLRAFYVSLINGVRPSSVTAPEARVEDHTRTVSPGIF